MSEFPAECAAPFFAFNRRRVIEADCPLINTEATPYQYENVLNRRNAPAVPL
jgi:hypothetical protein